MELKHWRVKQICSIWGLLAYCLLCSSVVFAGKEMNGFDLSNHLVPLEEIQFGGPGRDGIPAIHDPKFISASKAVFLKRNDRVLGISNGQVSKAYPIRILNWHEVVNDRLGEKPVLITYCPLCGTGMGFDPVIKGKGFTFGVSGLLYQSDVLMYDHQTESLWSQIRQEAVTGKIAGEKLPLIPLIHTTWGAWQEEHPKTLVLSTETGFKRDYGYDPYQSYADSSRLMFLPKQLDARLGPKEWVLGVTLHEIQKAYPFSELEKGPKSFSETFGEKKVSIAFDPATRTARVKDIEGNDIPSIVAYWFAWAAFYPNTKIYQHLSSPE